MDQQKEKLRKPRKTREQIADILKKFSDSNCTVKQFCEDHQIVPGTLHKWRSRVKGKSLKKETKAGFAQIQVNSSLSSLFAKVKGIRIYQPVSAAYLKELLA
jgi:transposase-like protein